MKAYLAYAVCALAACGGATVGDIDGGSDASTTPDAPVLDGGGQDAGATCSKSQPCPTGMQCGYAESAGCNATTGQCSVTGAICNTFQPGCACDGTTINIACTGLPDGYSTAPLAHAGLCDGGK